MRGKRDQFASTGALCDFNAEVKEAECLMLQNHIFELAPQQFLSLKPGPQTTEALNFSHIPGALSARPAGLVSAQSLPEDCAIQTHGL